MLPEDINPHLYETKPNDPHRHSTKKKKRSTKKHKTRKSKLLLSMPTKSEIPLEKMISLAKIHREANRPLIKIKEFDGQTKFCQCCSLPSRDDIYLRNCSFCENTDKFAEYGRGTSLYFSFFRFSILIMICCMVSMALPGFLLTSNYTNEMSDVCKNIYDEIGPVINKTFPDCLLFISGLERNEENTSSIDDWEFRFNTRNVLIYRDLFVNYGGTKKNIKSNTINYNILHLIGLASLFVISVLYIILLENINRQYDIDVISPGDYTIIISNLYSAFDIFWKKINKINSRKKNKNQNDSEESKSQEKTNYSLERKEAEEIGLEDISNNEEINILDAFNQFIKNKICVTDKGEKYNIYNINICYKIDEFMEMEEKIQEIKKEIYKINNEKFQIIKNRLMSLTNEKRRFFYNPLDFLDLNACQGECCERYHVLSDIIDEKSDLEKKLHELLEETKTLTEKNFSGVVFITFNSIEESEQFLKPYPKSMITSFCMNIINLKYFCCCCCIDKNKRKNFFLKRNITVEEAPEPEDIIFENLQCSSCQRFVRILFIYIFSLVIIGICFVIILFLNNFQAKRNNKKGTSSLVKYGLSIAISLVVSILNAIFQFILEKLTKREKQISMTNFYLSYSIKLTLFTFCTSAIIPLISNYIFYGAKFDLLVTNMLMMFLTNAFLTPFMWSMNFEFLLKKLKICLLKQNQETYTQKELNELYELLDMSIASKYSYIFKTLLMSFFFMPIFPLSIAISLVGFIFGYFLEKFNFSKMYKRPDILNSEICEFYSNYFTINFFMLAIGDFIFLEEENNKGILTILNVIVFGALIIIPINQIFDIDFIGINESDLNKEKYEECYFTFFNDYEKANPMTKKEGIKNFMLKLEKDGLISRSEYSQIIANFDNANLMETYYKARKNLGNSMAQQAFVNRKKMSTLRKKTNHRKATLLQTFKDIQNNRQTRKTLRNIIAETKHRSKKKSTHVEEEKIIEEKNNESQEGSENEKKSNNSFNMSFSVNDSIRETEQNNFNFSNNSEHNIQNRFSMKKNSKLPRPNLKRRQNIVGEEQQQAILNIAYMYNNPFLFGIKHLCDGVNEEEDEEKSDEESEESEESEQSEPSEPSQNGSRNVNIDQKQKISIGKSIDFNNIKSVDEPFVKEENKQEEKPKKKLIKIRIKKKIKVKKKIKIKIKVKKVKKKKPNIDFQNYNYDWLNLINK